MSKKEEDYFLQNIRGVKPIEKKHHIRKKINKVPKNIIGEGKLKKKKVTTKGENKKKESTFLMEFGKTNKKLKSGKINIDKKIDFHGKTLSEAESFFKNSVIENYNRQKRCLLFITGKGLNKKNYSNSGFSEQEPKLFYGRIRSAFLEWVRKPEFGRFILTVENANIENGGDGAFFVYLRKKPNQLTP
tara:strand:+ start:293 stop:856 length:564 start_codon:yes stop_codon:yes gene_type:complete